MAFKPANYGMEISNACGVRGKRIDALHRKQAPEGNEGDASLYSSGVFISGAFTRQRRGVATRRGHEEEGEEFRERQR
jgi:hypothetical protein